MTHDSLPPDGTPTSLKGHTVDECQRAIIAGHVALLSQTALAVSQRLPLQADGGDVFAVMAGDCTAGAKEVDHDAG